MTSSNSSMICKSIRCIRGLALIPFVSAALAACSKPEAGGSASSPEFKDRYEEFGGVKYVDLGLPSGLKWARCNLGADQPWETGGFFSWGETAPKTEFTLHNYRFASKAMSQWHPTKYNRYKFSSLRDDKIDLEPEDDAATAMLGAQWHIPRPADFNELFKACQADFITVEGMKGMLLTGPNGNMLFLPCGGEFYIPRDKYESSNDFVDQGFYWTNTMGYAEERDIFEQEEAISAYFSAYYKTKRTARDYRPNGLNIRPVSK